MEDPTLEHVGGSVHTLIEINPDKLSFFEIRDLCYLVGAPKEHNRCRYLLPEGNVEDDLRDIETVANVMNMTTLHRAWPINKIIIYIDIDVKPLAVEHPDGGGVANDGVGGDVGGVGGDRGVDEINVDRKKKMMRMLRMLRLVIKLKNKMLRLVQGLKNRMLKEMMMMIGYMKA